jgi:hypothetical protein
MGPEPFYLGVHFTDDPVHIAFLRIFVKSKVAIIQQEPQVSNAHMRWR